MPEVVTSTCPACGARAPADDRFCSQCAAPLRGTFSAPVPAPFDPSGRAAKTSGWVKALIIALIVGVVAAVTVAIVLAIGIGRASKTLTTALTPEPGRPSGYHGPSYPGMLTQDQVAGGGGSRLDAADETLTAGNLSRTASFLGPTLCSPVTITNHSTATKDVGPLEWKLQQPNGIVETVAITGTLQIGQVAPGGTAAGTVCFADSGQSGTFLLLWQPLFRTGRGVWLLPA